MDPNYINIFDEPVRYRRKRRNAGYSVAAIVVLVALVVIVLLIWYQTMTPANTAVVGDDPALLLDRESRDAARQTATSTNRDSNNDVMSDTEVAAVRTYTRAELSGIQTRLEAEEDFEAARQEVAQLRADLEGAYAETAGTSYEDWTELRAELEALENTLREGSADSLSMLSGLLQALEAEVRIDEGAQ